jgi:cellulose synthase/poly-beta-1,6-N-acetylglucosamine synthase-like glycosyltransferase
MESDYPHELIQVIAIDDRSEDDSWEWLQKIQSEYPHNVKVSQNDVNQGKAKNLYTLAKLADGEILFSIDSDTIVVRETISNMISCFDDPLMGAVGAQIRVKNLNDSIFSQYQGVSYASQFFFYKTLENQFMVSRCLFGPLVAYRASVYKQLIELIPKRNFLGSKITYGEDAYLTTCMCLGKGVDKIYKAYNNLEAIAWTGQPATYTKFANQQMRWWRGSNENSLGVVKDLWGNTQRAGMIATLIMILLNMAQVAALIMLVYFSFAGIWLNVFMAMIFSSTLYGICRNYIYNYAIGYKDKIAGPIKNPLLVGIFTGAWVHVVVFILPLVAMFTLDDPGWVTRQKNSGNV